MKVNSTIVLGDKKWWITSTRHDGTVTTSPEHRVPDNGYLRIEHDDLSPRRLLRRWIPTPRDLNEEFELTITLPKHYRQLVGNGTYAEGKLTWKTTRRLAPYFVAGLEEAVPEHLAELPNQQLPIRVLTRLGDEFAKAVAKYAERCLNVLADWLEADFPHDRLDIDLRGSHPMEYPGVVRCGVRDLPHELVHQWFGCHARASSDDGMWVDEALAELLTERTLVPFEAHPAALRATFGRARATTPRAAYTYGAWALSTLRPLELRDRACGLVGKLWDHDPFGLGEELVGHPYAPTEPVILEPKGDPVPNRHRLAFPAFRPPRKGAAATEEPGTAPSDRSKLRLAGRASGRAQIWDGPTWAKNSSGVIIAVGYRSPTVDDQATEWWALAPGVRLNVDTGTVDRTFVSPSGPDPGVDDLTSFLDWAEAHLDLTDAEIFEHQVTVHQ